MVEDWKIARVRAHVVQLEQSTIMTYRSEQRFVQPTRPTVSWGIMQNIGFATQGSSIGIVVRLKTSYAKFGLGTFMFRWRTTWRLSALGQGRSDRTNRPLCLAWLSAGHRRTSSCVNGHGEM